MARIPRTRLGCGVFHVLNRSYDSKFIFENDVDKEKLLSLLSEHKQHYQLNIYHWVIMSNHFHLAIEAVKIEELSKFIGKVCELYSRYWRKTYGGAGTLWQSRFKSMVVQKTGYLNKLGRYIERNPVAAELCDYSWDYPWSSAYAYVHGKDDDLVKVDELSIYTAMGNTREKRCLRYKSFLLSEKELWQNEAELFRSSAPVVGDDWFVSQAVLRYGRLTSRRIGRPRTHQIK
jgi:REP-associated tyrosine transposase